MDRSRILYQPINNIAYLHNPKVACSSIKSSLLKGKVKNVHEAFLFPPYNNPHVDIFSVVRNPFSRVVSAYLDKIGAGKDHYVWLPFCKQFDLNPEENLDFIDFLNILDSASPQELDHHFSPQVENLLAEFITPKFIGFIEDMKSVEDFLNLYGVKLETRAPHKTKSKELAPKLLSEEAIGLILKIYKDDFDRYGYSPDPTVISSKFSSPILSEQKLSDDLTFQHHKYDISGSTELLRDSAVLLEQVDLKKSYQLMLLAQQLRPMGTYINEKVEEYKRQLES